MNFAEEVARKKLRRGADWKLLGWECVGETTDLLVQGSTPIGVYARGPRKGRNKYLRPCERCVVTRAEIDSAASAWEAQTGKCSKCEGSGQEWAGWSSDEGNRYRDCYRCKATGVAP